MTLDDLCTGRPLRRAPFGDHRVSIRPFWRQAYKNVGRFFVARNTNSSALLSALCPNDIIQIDTLEFEVEIICTG